MHTQGRLELGRMELNGDKPLIATIDGGQRAIAAVYSSIDAVELVRRWNAFEPGGAVRLALDVLRMTETNINAYECPWCETHLGEHQCDNGLEIGRAIRSLAALVEPGAGVRE